MSQNSKLDEFEKYLDGKSEVSQLYAELPEVVLPDHLDAAILAEAHRAVNSRPGAKLRRRWAVPLSMVATLFVAVMIGLQLPYMLKDTTQRPIPTEEKVAAMMDKSMAEHSSVVQEERKKTQEMAQVTARKKSEISRGAPAPMEAEVAVSATQNAAVGALPPASVAAKRMELMERADVDSGIALSKEKKAVAHAEGNLSDAFEQLAPAAAAPAPVQLNRSLMQPLKDEASVANLRPEDWLLRIKKLKQEGKLVEAKKDLAAFKKRYPDYSVPEALDSQLSQ